MYNLAPKTYNMLSITHNMVKNASKGVAARIEYYRCLRAREGPGPLFFFITLGLELSDTKVYEP